MSQSSTSKPKDEATGNAVVAALLQFFLFLFGTIVGTSGSGRTSSLLLVLGVGLCAPFVLAAAEATIRRSVSIGTGDELPNLSGGVGALVAIVTGVSVLYDAGTFCCTGFFLAPIAGLALYNLLAFFVLGFRVLSEERARRTWTRVEVIASDGGIATLRSAGTLMRVANDVPVGIAWADIEETPPGYRLPAVSCLRNFESEKTRDVRRALAKLALVRLGSALMWGAVGYSPFMSGTIWSINEAW